MDAISKNKCSCLFFRFKTRPFLVSFQNLNYFTIWKKWNVVKVFCCNQGAFTWRVRRVLTCELREQTDLFLPWTHLLLCNMSMLTTSKLLHVFIGEEKNLLKYLGNWWISVLVSKAKMFKWKFVHGVRYWCCHCRKSTSIFCTILEKWKLENVVQLLVQSFDIFFLILWTFNFYELMKIM